MAGSDSVDRDPSQAASWRKDVAAGAGFIAVFVVVWWAASLSRSPDAIRAFWQPAPGLALAFLLIRGTRMAPAVAIAQILTLATTSDLTLGPLLLSAVVGTVVLSLAATILRHPALRSGSSEVAPMAAVVIAALLIPSIHHGLVALISPGAWVGEGARATLAETAAALLTTPFILAHAGRLPWPFGASPWSKRVRSTDGPTVGGWLAVAMVAVVVSIMDVHPATNDVRTSYLLLVPVGWVALRYGTGAVIGTMLLTNIAYVAAVTAIEPLEPTAVYQSLLLGINLAALLIAAVAGAKGQVLAMLRERDRFYRLVADNSTDVIVVIRPDGICEYASPSAQTVFGWRPDQLTGTQLRDLVHPDDVERSVQDFERSLHRQTPTSVLRIRNADGDYRWIERTARVFEDPAEPSRPKLVAVARDISERQQLEESLRQSQKLESVGRLAGGVAHDFNNLLTAILGHASLLQEDDRLPSDVIGQVGEMRHAAERAAGLTGQLLAFARRQVADPKVVDLNELAGGMERLLHRVLGEHIRLRTDLAADLWRVRIDPGQMEQVLMNLAVNARDAMPTGGQLSMRTGNRTSRDRSPFDPLTGTGDHVEIAVSDSGEGMSAETRARIFEPFFTTKAVGKGTGLGLAVCDGIVRQSGGRIDVESTPGRGTTFVIRLPVSAEDPYDDTVTSSRGIAGSGDGETILIVEDEAQVRELIVKVLRGDGYRVLTAETGEEALEMVRGGSIRVEALITDVLLPGMSGPRLADAIRDRDPHARILFMSGFADADLEAQRADWALGGFLSKPFSPETLRARVRDLLDNTLTPATGLSRVPEALHAARTR